MHGVQSSLRRLGGAHTSEHCPVVGCRPHLALVLAKFGPQSARFGPTSAEIGPNPRPMLSKPWTSSVRFVPGVTNFGPISTRCWAKLVELDQIWSDVGRSLAEFDQSWPLAGNLFANVWPTSTDSGRSRPIRGQSWRHVDQIWVDTGQVLTDSEGRSIDTGEQTFGCSDPPHAEQLW